MVERYSTLFIQLKIIEYQLKKEARQHGQDAATMVHRGKRGFVKPEVFKKILGK